MHTCLPAATPTGFVDIHNHGVGSGDSSSGKCCEQEVTQFWSNPSFTCRLVAQHGTTSVFATLTFPGGPGTEEDAQAREVVDALELVVGKAFPGCAVLEGIHAEGPLVADLGGLPSSTYAVRRGTVVGGTHTHSRGCTVLGGGWGVGHATPRADQPLCVRVGV